MSKSEHVSFTLPTELLKIVDKYVKEQKAKFNPSYSRSQFMWECMESLLGDEASEIIDQYIKERDEGRKNHPGRPKENDAWIKRKIRKVLKESNDPLALTQIVNGVEGVGRKRLSRVVDDMQEENEIVIHKPKEVGKSWSIALIGTEAEETVNKLLRVEDNTARINKRRKRKRKKKKKTRTVGE